MTRSRSRACGEQRIVGGERIGLVEQADGEQKIRLLDRVDPKVIEAVDEIGIPLRPEVEVAPAEPGMDAAARRERVVRGLARGDQAIVGFRRHADLGEALGYHARAARRVRQEAYRRARGAQGRQRLEHARIGLDAAVDHAPQIDDQRVVVGRDLAQAADHGHGSRHERPFSKHPGVLAMEPPGL